MTTCKLSIKVVVVVIMTVNELGRRGTDELILENLSNLNPTYSIC
jgi:hypothetical protein